MFQRCVLSLAVILLLSPLAFAVTAKKVTLDVPKNVPPVNGHQMYAGYCASCHGVDGRGNGPLASRLTVHPADLTRLTLANHGKYPDSHVLAVIEHGSDGHGAASGQMPNWAPILLNLSHRDQMQQMQRESNLARYVKELQATK